MTAEWNAGRLDELLADYTPDCLFLLSTDGVVLAANTSCCECLDVDRAALIGRSLADVGLVGEAVEELALLVEHVQRTGIPLHTSFQLATQSGRAERHDLVLSPLYHQGELVALHGRSHGVSDYADVDAERDRLQRRLEALWRIAGLVDADYQTLCDHVVNEIVEMSGSVHAFWGYVDASARNLYFHVWAEQTRQACGVELVEGQGLDVASGGLWAEPIRQRRPVIVNDYRASAAAGQPVLPAGHVPLERLLLAPVLYRGQIVAVAGVANKSAPYTQRDAQEVQGFLNSVQAILDRRKAQEELARFNEEIRQRNRQQEILNHVTAQFNAATQVDQILDATLKAVGDLGLRYCSVWAKQDGRLYWYLRPLSSLAQVVSRVASLQEPFQGRNIDIWLAMASDHFMAKAAETGQMQRARPEGFAEALHFGDRRFTQLPDDVQALVVQTTADLGITEYVALPFADYVMLACNPDADRRGANLYEWAYTLAQQAGVAVERQQAVDALRQSEHRFRDLIESVSDWFWEVDAENRFTYVSPQVKRVLGYQPEELIGRTPFDFMPPGEAKRVSAIFAAHVETRQGSSHLENTSLHKDGHQVVLETSFEPVLGPENRLLGWRGVDRDVTSRIQAQRMALQMSRIEATAALAGGIAHDFNNLMVGVLGYAELLRAELPNTLDVSRSEEDRQRSFQDMSEMLGVIADSAQEAGRLAQQMLAFAQGGDHEPREVSVNDTMQEVVRLQERQIAKGVRVDLELGPNVWPIHADPTQMSHVVLNLFTNALEAVGSQGHIRLVSRNVELDMIEAARFPELEAGPHVEIAVQDDGPGMSEDVQAKIFSPFFSTKEFGRGLGLAAVYGIVQNHGGHIAVSSAPGHGTMFRVLLPARVGPSLDASGASAQPAATEEGRATILVVDDEAAVLGVTRRMLERLGYDVLEAKEAYQAIQIAQEHAGPIDAILLDMAMPGMSGAQAYPLLKAARPEAKVFICSGYDMDEDAHHMLQSGAYAFIAKPFGFTKLDEELRGALTD